MKPIIPIFDFGGTIVDLSFECLLEMAQIILENTGRSILAGKLRGEIQRELDNRYDLKDLRRVRRLTEFDAEADYFQDVFQGVLDRLEVHSPDKGLSRRLARLYLDPYSYAPLPGVVDTLMAYREEKVPIALLSNSSPMTRELLAVSGLGKYFSAIVLSHEVGHVKPEPYIYRYVLKQLDGIPAENTVYVDDRLHFVRGACFVGMRGVHFIRDTKTNSLQEVTSPSGSLKYYTIDAFPQVRQLIEAFSIAQVRQSSNTCHEDVSIRFGFQEYYV